MSRQQDDDYVELTDEQRLEMVRQRILEIEGQVWTHRLRVVELSAESRPILAEAAAERAEAEEKQVDALEQAIAALVGVADGLRERIGGKDDDTEAAAGAHPPAVEGAP